MSCFVFVKRSCGQVPATYERQTLGSVRESCAARELAEPPISCSRSLRCSAAMISRGMVVLGGLLEVEGKELNEGRTFLYTTVRFSS